MDKNVVVRFFELTGIEGNSPAVPMGLRRMIRLSPSERENEVDDGVILRLEHLTEEGSYFLGDITRVQERNLPGHVKDDGIGDLPVDRIGHPVAFLYDSDTRALVLQYDQRSGIGRVCRYFRHAIGGKDVGYLPLIKKDATARFSAQTPTELELTIARMGDFSKIRDSGEDFEDAIEDMARMYDGNTIKLVISAKEGLDKARVINTIRRFLGYREINKTIKTIKANTLESEFPFDFIKDLLKEEHLLDIPDKDTDKNRKVRFDFVRGSYAKHYDYIKKCLDG